MAHGYYDRFLPKCMNAVKLLIAYEAQRVTELTPEPTDIPGITS
jgi:5-formyltetrahydrofolate cyclo-ligase